VEEVETLFEKGLAVRFWIGQEFHNRRSNSTPNKYFSGLWSCIQREFEGALI